MENNNHQIVIDDNDLVYTYKEQFFTGFAPCFQGGTYSLACCKGAKNGRGMRQSICKAIKNNKNVWVLSIAGADIVRKFHNCSTIEYEPGDAICLAKIKDCLAWNDYSQEQEYMERIDSYYVLDNDKVTWREKIKGVHDTEDYLIRDCALGLSCSGKRTEANIFREEKQILIANEYYVFEDGHNISNSPELKELDVKRGFKCADTGEISRASILRSFVEKNQPFDWGWKDPFKEKCRQTHEGCKICEWRHQHMRQESTLQPYVSDTYSSCSC